MILASASVHRIPTLFYGSDGFGIDTIHQVPSLQGLGIDTIHQIPSLQGFGAYTRGVDYSCTVDDTGAAYLCTAMGAQSAMDYTALQSALNQALAKIGMSNVTITPTADIGGPLVQLLNTALSAPTIATKLALPSAAPVPATLDSVARDPAAYTQMLRMAMSGAPMPGIGLSKTAKLLLWSAVGVVAVVGIIMLAGAGGGGSEAAPPAAPAGT